MKKINWIFLLFIFILNGCQFLKGNDGCVQSYAFTPEPDWIRNGQPLEFEGGLWYPIDETESLLDSEVIRMGEFNGVEFFTERMDVRPFGRLYTKFGRNQFRIFEKRK